MMKIELQNQNDKKYVPNKETIHCPYQGTRKFSWIRPWPIYLTIIWGSFSIRINTKRALNNERPKTIHITRSLSDQHSSHPILFLKGFCIWTIYTCTNRIAWLNKLHSIPPECLGCLSSSKDPVVPLTQGYPHRNISCLVWSIDNVHVLLCKEWWWLV